MGAFREIPRKINTNESLMLLCPLGLYSNSITTVNLSSFNALVRKCGHLPKACSRESSKTALYWFYSTTSDEVTLWFS